ncbi:acyl-CoA synthetase family member 3 isoform X2 [Musca autumnalis]|uniref:acyl-CoA synthetase family member 3 isoform X2 n=1 Tax=Musca autumnalis TaxID=221902 RepID=UPI003CECCB45
MNNFCKIRVINACKRLFSSLVVQHAPPEYLSRLRECYRLEEYKKIVVPIFKKALLYGNQVAIRDASGDYSYLQLYVNSKRLSKQISNICGSGSSASVGFFFTNDVLNILNLWACWMSGQVALPLKSHWTFEQLKHILTESKVKTLLTPKLTQELAQQLAESQEIALITVDYNFVKNQNYSFNFNREIFMADKLVVFEGILQNNFYTNADAMKIYCIDKKNNDEMQHHILSHKHINSEMKAIANVWNMSATDRVLSIPPSMDINNCCTSNALFPLISGSMLQIHSPFDAVKAWSIILGIKIPVKERINVMVAETKVFELLIKEYEKIFSKDSRMMDYIKDYCTKHIRLMISTNGKLSSRTFAKWFEITGHSIFENSEVITCRSKFKNVSTNTEENEIDINLNNLMLSNYKFRIMNSENTVLLESSGTANIKYINSSSGTVIGHLWISSPGQDTYINTGKVVAYEDGNVTVLGPSNKM